uniref:C-type lectin domain-containing protein n=1 Tax=Nothobranchius furzeri TaxID=105023 RepID=A0A8C6LXP7_NOTFU
DSWHQLIVLIGFTPNRLLCIVGKHQRYQPSVTCDGDWELFRGHFYYFTTNYSTWEGSRGFCEDLGADLVHVLTDFIIKFLHLIPEDKFWIGLTDSENESSWIWVDGSPLNTKYNDYEKIYFDRFQKKKTPDLILLVLSDLHLIV